jgi:hypothetical protein
MNESVGASAVKVTAVAAGAAMSGMQSVAASIGDNGQHAIWFVTLAYGILQIYKNVPTYAMVTVSIWQGLRYGKWEQFKSISRREQKASDEGSV